MIEDQKLTFHRSPVKWKKPVGNIPKLNFDGAFDREKFRSASEIVVRDATRSVLLSCSKIHDRVSSSFYAEALACLLAVRVAVDQGWMVVEVEGDALAIIKKCQSDTRDFSQISSQIEDIHQIKRRLQSIAFRYVPREANHLAHVLATETLKRSEGFYLGNGVPNFAEDAMLVEKDWEPD